jgi:hypothetical protein
MPREKNFPAALRVLGELGSGKIILAYFSRVGLYEFYPFDKIFVGQLSAERAFKLTQPILLLLFSV